MSLQYLNAQTIGTYLSCAWQNDLNTTEDPANGQWYTTGANGDQIGLYGGLTDSVPQQLTLDTSASVYSPQEIVADTAIVNNLNGLSPSSTVTLSYQYSTSVTSTHSTTVAIKLGAQFTFKVNEIVAEGSAQFSIGFDFSSTNSTANTTTQAQTFSQSVPVTVPKGTVYQVVLTAESQEITIPYTVPIQVTGTTETWFESTVNGHYNWSVDAGTAFGWINQYACAGTDSPAYSNAGNGVGAVTIAGSLNASQVANFTAVVYDITAYYVAHGTAPGIPLSGTPAGASAAATLVAKTPL